MDQIEKLNELTSLLEAQNNKVKELIEEIEKDQEPERRKEIRLPSRGMYTEKIIKRIEVNSITIEGNVPIQKLYFELRGIPDLIKALKELSGVE